MNAPLRGRPANVATAAAAAAAAAAGGEKADD